MALRITGCRRVRLVVSVLSTDEATGESTVGWRAMLEGRMLLSSGTRKLVPGGTLEIDYELVLDEGLAAVDRLVIDGASL